MYIAVTIVEVERLWLRFQQLGCDKDGTLTTDALQQPGMVDDVFMRNVSGNQASCHTVRCINRCCPPKGEYACTHYTQM